MTKLIAHNSHTNETKSFETGVDESVIVAEFSEELIDEDTLDKDLDNLKISAEAKLLLSQLKKFTIQVGDTAIQIGRRLLEVLVYLIKNNPKTAAGFLIGSLIGLILSSIPVFGWALGWIIQPLFMALGLAIGFYQDMNESKLKQEINTAISDVFSSITGAA